MAFGKSFILCSPFSGPAVIEGGKPLGDVVMERRWVWSWNDETGSDRAVTDANGKFAFPLVKGSSMSAMFLPHEPNIRQTIIAHMPDGELEIWNAVKATYEMNSELDGRPIKVICHLDKEPSADGLYWGTCVEDK